MYVCSDILQDSTSSDKSVSAPRLTIYLPVKYISVPSYLTMSKNRKIMWAACLLTFTARLPLSGFLWQLPWNRLAQDLSVYEGQHDNTKPIGISDKIYPVNQDSILPFSSTINCQTLKWIIDTLRSFCIRVLITASGACSITTYTYIENMLFYFWHDKMQQ